MTFFRPLCWFEIETRENDAGLRVVIYWYASETNGAPGMEKSERWQFGGTPAEVDGGRTNTSEDLFRLAEGVIHHLQTERANCQYGKQNGGAVVLKCD